MGSYRILKLSKLFADMGYSFGDIVFLKTDPEQLERIVTGIMLRPSGAVLYDLSCGMHSSYHYEFEISGDKDLLKQINQS